MPNSKEKLEKVIPICDKEIATFEEIFDYCNAVCKVNFFADAISKTDASDRRTLSKGLLSLSYHKSGSLSLCLWEETKEGKFKIVRRFGTIDLASLITLREIANVAVQITADRYVEGKPE